jgi:hypothetical protein
VLEHGFVFEGMTSWADSEAGIFMGEFKVDYLG